ncbi:MAG: hypothetical protein KBA43_02975 [Paludibacteraceae bacterium]|nr:hypothetical protein [Paludibacteraceae bacterium]HPI29665.1 hypothetical protein [Bacteroidales bacterium]
MKNIYTIIFVSLTITVLGQTNQAVVKENWKTVPYGKKWVINTNKSIVCMASTSIHKSGSDCYELYFSTPQLFSYINSCEIDNRGEMINIKTFSFVFSGSHEVESGFYEFTPITIIDKNISLSDLRINKPEDLGLKQLIFKSGEKVFVSGCIEALFIDEENMTTQDFIQQEEEKIDKAKKFSIPVHPEKYVTPGTKPILKDSLFKYVVFECMGVLSNNKNQKSVYNDTQKWTLTLSQKMFEIKSFDKTESYTVLDSRYDEQTKSQEFQLADYSGQFTHKLNLSYIYSLKTYIIVFGSENNSWEFQFQNIILKDIQYQTILK